MTPTDVAVVKDLLTLTLFQVFFLRITLIIRKGLPGRRTKPLRVIYCFPKAHLPRAPKQHA